MAKPQLENGHTQIANEILEHLIRLHLAPNQWQIVLCIIRKTYGYHKKVDRITNSQIMESTGLCKEVVSRNLKRLQDINVITRKGKQVGLQKDWERWEKLTEQSTLDSGLINQELTESSTIGVKLAEQSTNEKLTKLSTEVDQTVNKKLTKLSTTKEKKETIKRKYIYIYEKWNEQNIINHKKLTSDIEKAIDSTLKDYTEEEIIQAINNYSVIVKGEEYYFNHKWTLAEFLSRNKHNNIERFLDLEIAKQNFLKDRDNGKNKPRQLPKTYTRPEDL